MNPSSSSRQRTWAAVSPLQPVCARTSCLVRGLSGFFKKTAFAAPIRSREASQGQVRLTVFTRDGDFAAKDSAHAPRIPVIMACVNKMAAAVFRRRDYGWADVGRSPAVSSGTTAPPSRRSAYHFRCDRVRGESMRDRATSPARSLPVRTGFPSDTITRFHSQWGSMSRPEDGLP